MANRLKLRVARVAGTREQWFARKKVGVRNGFARTAIKYDRPDRHYRFAPGANVPWFGSGPNVGPILTNLASAKTAAALHTTQGRTDATTAFNAAKTKVNALRSEEITAAIAAIDAGIANIALATTPGDNAAIVNADAAIAAVNQF